MARRSFVSSATSVAMAVRLPTHLAFEALQLGQSAHHAVERLDALAQLRHLRHRGFGLTKGGSLRLRSHTGGLMIAGGLRGLHASRFCVGLTPARLRRSRATPRRRDALG
jgi:hypothetical protein